MTETDKPVEVVLVACEICLKEVPSNDMAHPETDDYVVHFCGLACYEIWKNQDVVGED